MSYINDIIEQKRESICEADGISIYATFITFKRMYKKAIQSKNEKDVREALKYYKDHSFEFKSITFVDHKAKDMAKELDNILKEIDTIKAKEGKKKLTVSDIKRELMIIVRRYNNDPKIISELKKHKANKFICHIFEEYDNEVSFEVSKDDQEIRIKISGIIYDMAQDLEKSLAPSISCDTGDGDEGVIWVTY